MQIPYRIILNPSITKFLEEKGTQVTLAPEFTSITEEESTKLVSESENDTNPALIASTATTRIPHYSPRNNLIRFKPSHSAHEKIWVLDDSNNEIRPNNESSKTLSYKALPGYFVIHGDNNLDGTYSITIYKLILKGSFKTGQIIQSFTFTSESSVPKQYKHYAAVLRMST